MTLFPLIVLAALVAGPPPDEPVAVRFEALAKQHDARMAAFFRAYHSTDDRAKQTEIARTMHPDDAAYATQFLALASEEPAGSAAPDALYWVLQLQHGPLTPIGKEALARLGRDHTTSPKMGEYLQQLSLHPWPGMEELLRDVLSRNPDRTAQGHACLGLAGMMAGHAAIQKYCNDPAMAAKFDREHGPEVMANLLRRDPVADLREAVELHLRVVNEYADVRLFPAYPTDKRTIGPVAQRWLGNHDELGINKVAPEIEGHDVDGKTFKLSDYRGKVVVVVFWASWCGPCMEQIPDERALAAKMAGKPFVLLGVNCDYNLADARKVLDKEQLTWPNWYDGDLQAKHHTDGPIRDKYHIQGIPSVFVIDAEGVIRELDVRGIELERAVEEQLKRIKP